MKKTITTLAVAAAFAGGAQAATIVWGTAQAITGDSDVSTNGTLVLAQNYGSGGAQTVNGVAFADAAPDVGTPQDTPTAAAPGAANTVDALLDDASWNGGGAQTITLSGLTVGQQYEIQVFQADTRGCCNGRVGTVANTDGSGAQSDSVGTPHFFIGTFTADAATQGYQSFNDADTGHFINAVQVRNVTVPEPSSSALLGLAGLALILRRRK